MHALIPILTSNTSEPGFVASAHSERGCGAWNAFDGSSIGVADYWTCTDYQFTDSIGDVWLAIELPTWALVKKYSISYLPHEMDLRTWTMDALINDRWVTLNAPGIQSTHSGAVEFSLSDNYLTAKKYRLHITKNWGATAAAVGEWQLYGNWAFSNGYNLVPDLLLLSNSVELAF